MSVFSRNPPTALRPVTRWITVSPLVDPPTNASHELAVHDCPFAATVAELGSGWVTVVDVAVVIPE